MYFFLNYFSYWIITSIVSPFCCVPLKSVLHYTDRISYLIFLSLILDSYLSYYKLCNFKDVILQKRVKFSSIQHVLWRCLNLVFLRPFRKILLGTEIKFVHRTRSLISICVYDPSYHMLFCFWQSFPCLCIISFLFYHLIFWWDDTRQLGKTWMREFLLHSFSNFTDFLKEFLERFKPCDLQHNFIGNRRGYISLWSHLFLVVQLDGILKGPMRWHLICSIFNSRVLSVLIPHNLPRY